MFKKKIIRIARFNSISEFEVWQIGTGTKVISCQLLPVSFNVVEDEVGKFTMNAEYVIAAQYWSES